MCLILILIAFLLQTSIFLPGANRPEQSCRDQQNLPQMLGISLVVVIGPVSISSANFDRKTSLISTACLFSNQQIFTAHCILKDPIISVPLFDYQ